MCVGREACKRTKAMNRMNGMDRVVTNGRGAKGGEGGLSERASGG